jgi:hypothetical protein
MSEIGVESVFWVLGILLFGIAALFPHGFIRFLGRDRVTPGPTTLVAFRVLAAFCVVGLIYRIVWLYRR